MNARTGMTLRLIGPLIEVVCLIVLLRVRDQNLTFLGLPVEYGLYAGLALGLTLVIVGVLLVTTYARSPSDPGASKEST